MARVGQCSQFPSVSRSAGVRGCAPIQEHKRGRYSGLLLCSTGKSVMALGLRNP